MVDYKNILTGVAERLSSLREERPSAGTRYRLMGVLADIMEAVEMLSKEVLDRVSQEAVLDADVDADFDVMSEEVLSWELTIKNDDLQELTQQVNDALGGLSNVLSQIGSQLSRHHSNMKDAGVPIDGVGMQAHYNVYGPSMEDIDDYLLEKLLHMFEKGVFCAKVEHIQRAKRYPGEFDFEQLDVDAESRKLIYKNYAVLRKLVDYTDGFLVVNAARVGQHFYASRREEKAKANRTNFLKYMHKITLAQEEYKKLQDAQQESEDSSLLPDVLATGMAMKYWKRLQKAGFVDEHYQLSPTTTRKQAMYIADVFSDKLQMRSKWKPFQELWHINNLAQEKWEMQETGKSPARSEEIDKIFED